jgi:hypothetical protein
LDLAIFFAPISLSHFSLHLLTASSRLAVWDHSVRLVEIAVWTLMGFPIPLMRRTQRPSPRPDLEDFAAADVVDD